MNLRGMEAHMLEAQDAIVKQTVAMMESKAAVFNKAMQVRAASLRKCIHVMCVHIMCVHVMCVHVMCIQRGKFTATMSLRRTLPMEGCWVPAYVRLAVLL